MEYIILLGYLYILGVLYYNLRKAIKNKESFFHIIISFLVILFYTISFIYRKLI